MSTSNQTGLVLSLAEDAWQGDAQFTIAVDGQVVGGPYTVTALRSAGQSQSFTVPASALGVGKHEVTVDFLNDAYGGTPSTDRNLYLLGASLNGAAVPNSTATLLSAGPASFNVNVPSPIPSTLVVDLSEDAWQGDAKCVITVDGVQIGGTYTVTALHNAGQTQPITLTGIQETGAAHDVAVTFLNDAYGGTPSTDRNLYLDSIKIDGQTVSGASATFLSAGTQHFSATAPAGWGSTATPQPPNAVADTATTAENTAVMIAVLANDTGSSGTIAPGSVVVGTAAGHGTTAVDPTTGQITYTPAANFTGTDTFQYTVADTSGVRSSPATVTVDVTAPATGTQPVSSTSGDGSSGAPSGTPQLPQLLNGYAARPAWKVAGVDYAVGVPAGTPLKDPSTISMAGVSVNTSKHLITITGNNVTLDGYNFGQGNGWGIYIPSGATNTTVENSSFLLGSNNYVPLNAANAGNLTVRDCTFDGNNSTNGTAWAMVNYAGSGAVDLEYNLFKNVPVDGVDFGRGNVNVTAKYNLFTNIGTSPGAHADSLQWDGSNSTSTTIAYNTVTSGEQGIQLDAQDGSTLLNSSVTNNVVVAQGPAQTISWLIAAGQSAGNNVANGIYVDNNYLDYTGAYGPFYTPSGTNMTYAGNVNMKTGAVIPSPAGTSSTPPATAQSSGSITSTLVLNVSEDAYLGDAQFTVNVDGKQEGGTYTATALHSAGQSQAITIANIPETFQPHEIAVTFLNDAYGGSPTADRNLYINGAQFDNQPVAGAAATMLWAATDTFQATAPANWTG